MKELKTYQLEAHEDNRGVLLANASKAVGEQINHFFIATIKPGEERGNHYHFHKKEWFIILDGTAELELIDIHTEEKKVIPIDSEDHLAFEMDTEIIHTVRNTSDHPIILIALVNEFLDKENPDTFSAAEKRA